MIQWMFEALKFAHFNINICIPVIKRWLQELILSIQLILFGSAPI